MNTIEEYGVIHYNENNEMYFSTIGLKPEFAHFYGVKDIDTIYKVKFEVHEDQSEPDWNALDYWGWLDFDNNKFSMIWPNYRLFHCCFTYGVKCEEKSGSGKSYRLKLVSYEKYNKE